MPSPFRRVAVVLLALACLAVPVSAPSAVAAPKKPTQLGDRALRPGAKGPDVRQLQAALDQAGFEVEIDGRYGDGTVRAVQRFQRVARLEPSGIVGRKTVAALRRALQGGAANAAGGGFSRDSARQRRRSLGDRIPVRLGMSGQDIRVLQDFLTRAGFKVKVDGEFGRSTKQAVEKFEAKQQHTVDGVVDAVDIDALRTLAGAAAAPRGAEAPLPLAPGDRATVGPDGLAAAPATAPPQVQQIIAAGNVIARKPYTYGGGHGKWDDSGYDCSGSVSYALHGAGLLEDALPSSGFFGWGEEGPGQWVTIYTKSSHMFMVVAGLRFDTTGRSRAGTRWQADMRSTAGYQARHPMGL